MGHKYMLSAYEYPYPGYAERVINTDYLIVAVLWFIVLSIQYFGVDVQKRG